MISFLWIYAFITGFSPAVQRATVMFTFVIIGNSLRRQINIYNSLTASAFFLILLNPEVIFDIGFQLSYLAVFGIVLIQPALDGLLELSNPMLKWCWSLFTVSLAAQFITFPLGLFYFNQFPNLFWLSSFVVIPITTLIIWLTLAFFIFSPLHGVSMMLGLIIEKITYCMLFLLKEMDALPYAVCRGIVLTPIQVSLLFAGIGALVIYFATKDKLWIFSTLALIILFQTSEIIERAKTIDQNIIIIYNSKNPMIHLINGRNNYILTKDFSKLSRSEKSTFERVRYHLRLDPAQIISDDNAKSNSIPNDLIINGNEVQFTNCLIRRESINNIELEVYRQENKLEPEKYTISFKNLNFGKQLTRGNFQIKEQGAFYCKLNQND
jgi:competence protein ComEC